jgi:hypothetical protein
MAFLRIKTQGKNGYRLNYIRAKRSDTSVAWINSIFLVMNLLILLRLFFALRKEGLAAVIWLVLRLQKSLQFHQRLRTINIDGLYSQAAGS